MLTVADIMTHEVIALAPEQSLADAHRLAREKGIRHIPVVEPESNALVGIVTQKNMIAKVIHLLTLYGKAKMEEQEASTNIMEIAEVDFDVVHSAQVLTEVAPFFLRNKHGCLPVTDAQHRLIGIVTSSDFVKLSVKLLEDDADA